MRHSFVVLVVLVILWCSISVSAQQAPDWSAVEKALGRTGKSQDGILRVGFPRTDLDVKVAGTKVEAAAGLGSWAAFRRTGDVTITDGDLVLKASEVNPVLVALRHGGLEVSAIHNHLIGETPQVMYVHFFGEGDATALARGLHAALDATATPAAGKTEVHPLPQQGVIEKALGKTGTVNGRALAFSFARGHDISMHKQILAPSMGMATAINFQSSPKGVAAMGDFVLLESEVQAVVDALLAGGIQVTAMHNHLQDEEPRMVFVHFWAEGVADDVAANLRKALDHTGHK